MPLFPVRLPFAFGHLACLVLLMLTARPLIIRWAKTKSVRSRNDRLGLNVVVIVCEIQGVVPPLWRRRVGKCLLLPAIWR